MIRQGDTVYCEFVTSRFDTGVATNADSLPTGTLNKNGTDDGAVTVTITNIDTGRYKAVFTVPTTYVIGDALNLSVAATVNAVAGKGVVWSGVLDSSLVQTSGKAQAGGASSITLAAAASATDSLYVGAVVSIISGTGAGQARVITAYVGSTKVATVGRNWITNPANDSIYLINGLSVPVVDSNLRVTANTDQWAGTTIPAPNVTGVPKVDIVDWLGSAPDALSSGKIPSDVKLWLASAPATLTTNGYVKAALLRWLTDDASGTPSVLNSGLVQSDIERIANAAVNTALAQLGVNVVSQANIDFGALQKTSLNAATPASVAGAVGSVTGNVGGNVVGNVNGNVVGSVGSLATQAKTDAENAVWNATQASHVASGTTGESLNDAGGVTPPSVQAIVDGVWDETLANHLDAGSTGEALNAASTSAGSGFYTVEIPCEVSGLPADGVAVRVTNDAAGIDIVAQATSNTNGTATVYLDAGTYYAFLARGGDTFPNPTTITVP